MYIMQVASKIHQKKKLIKRQTLLKHVKPINSYQSMQYTTRFPR